MSVGCQIRSASLGRSAPWLCVVFHGYAMDSDSMLEWVDSCSTDMDLLVLDAPVREGDQQQWFVYENDHEGRAEDAVCSADLEKTLQEVSQLVSQVAGARLEQNRVVALGLSEGGCFALELGARLDLAGIVTLVSYRRQQHGAPPTNCPWHALVATDDSIYPCSWASRAGARVVRVPDDHYLHKCGERASNFIEDSLARLVR